MGTDQVAAMLKTLQAKRVHAQTEVAKLDRAIAVLRTLSGPDAAPGRNGTKRTLSAAARQRIADAQRARWAKFRKEQKAKR
jgi:hypothetical protein